MTVPPASAPGQDAGENANRDARRRVAAARRLDEIFGDVLPTITDDERDPGERHGFDAEFYRANRPPHHVG